MARYRKVEVKTWSDDKFRELTPIPPCGQGLWLWFLTGTRTTNIPGIVIGTGRVMAAELNWSLEAFREAFREAYAKGMAKGDLEAGLVWLPNASRTGDGRNKPESPNVIRSWRDTWDEIPECPLKLEAWQQLKAFAEAFGEGFKKAFMEACRKPSLKASPNQEQEQEQNTERARDVDGGRPDAGAGLLAELQAEYPKGTYRQGNWMLAEREALRRLEEGGARQDLVAGCRRYRAQCEAREVIGTQYVMSPEKFFARGAAGAPYLEDFPLPASKKSKRDESPYREPPDAFDVARRKGLMD